MLLHIDLQYQKIVGINIFIINCTIVMLYTYKKSITMDLRLYITLQEDSDQ